MPSRRNPVPITNPRHEGAVFAPPRPTLTHARVLNRTLTSPASTYTGYENSHRPRTSAPSRDLRQIRIVTRMEEDEQILRVSGSAGAATFRDSVKNVSMNFGAVGITASATPQWTRSLCNCVCSTAA
uniref:Uncharacterized protein n=1 Tax=Physcomitrium patens TaxID=3218 RepID=A9RNH2_PHYPA|nr:hypothetical protein PHYPA_028491 [Physcomitrium patens]